MITDQKVVKQFLIIEDDVEISDVVAVNLESNGIKIEHVHDGLWGLKLRYVKFNTPIFIRTAKKRYKKSLNYKEPNYFFLLKC